MRLEVATRWTRRLRRLIDVRERQVSVLAGVAVQAARDHGDSLENVERAQRSLARWWADASRRLQTGMPGPRVAALGASLEGFRSELERSRSEERDCRDRLAAAHTAVLRARDTATALRRALVRAETERIRHEHREEARRRDELVAARRCVAAGGETP